MKEHCGRRSSKSFLIQNYGWSYAKKESDARISSNGKRPRVRRCVFMRRSTTELRVFRTLDLAALAFDISFLQRPKAKDHHFLRFLVCLTSPPNPTSAVPSRNIVDGSGTDDGVPTSLPIAPLIPWNLTRIALQI